MARARAIYVLNHFSRQIFSSCAGSVLAFKLIMLSPSSRAASCHIWVFHLLRLRRHTSQAFRLDILWLLARQTPWGLWGWFHNVTSSRYRTSYILGLFNKCSFRRQIDDPSRCIFWVFGVYVVHTCIFKTPLLWENKGTTKRAQNNSKCFLRRVTNVTR